jgi:hypothetical protein
LINSKLEEHLSSAVKIDSALKGVNSSWEDVLDYIQSSEMAYNAKAEKSWIRNWVRNSKVTAENLKIGVELIPDEKGLSVLRGGLCFMFDVILRDAAD